MNKLKKWQRILFITSVISATVLFSVFMFSGHLVTVSSQDSLNVEKDTDRPGNDYKDFDLPRADYELCRTACARDSNCRAYTYAHPGVYGRSNAHCWLKNPLPAASASTCCISGVKNGCGKGEFAGDWYAGEWGNITFNQSCDQVNGTYTRGNGSIYGTASGSRLNATWQQEGRIGAVYFIVLANGNMEGRYCDGNGCSPENGAYFSGRRR